MRFGKRVLSWALVTATLGIQTPGHAEVSVRLSQTSVTLGQPLQITFESTGTSVSPPDLSAIERDFQIINRRVRQQTSVRNGYRSQRSVLTLTLLPRRSGSLEIPSIAFGNERSAARSVTILAPAGRDNQASTTTPSWPETQGPWDPFDRRAPPYDMLPADPNYPAFNPSSPTFDPSRPAFGPGYPTLAPPSGRTDPPDAVPPSSETEAGRPIPRRTEPLASPTTEEPALPRTSLQQGRGYPGWLVALLAAGWLGTLGLFWRSRRSRVGSPAARAAAPAPAPPPAKPKPETAEESAIRAVRDAYEQGNAEAARAALLQWAKAVWPNEAPNNLPRLAERTDEPLRGWILKLDKAFYSPTPVNWHDDPVWQRLPRRG